ncbi:hypothetical protein GCM10025857_34580 [Alicyclobacillus contaminans]|nr:hypothetical protein GCM10025857_34580 [Alicyclobacillus contaminans]
MRGKNFIADRLARRYDYSRHHAQRGFHSNYFSDRIFKEQLVFSALLENLGFSPGWEWTG